MIRMRGGNTFKINSSGISSAVDIAIDSVDGGGQALIFAETRKRAPFACSQKRRGCLQRARQKAARELAVKTSSEIQARGDDSEITKTLAKLVSKGVAFHHAGLAPSSREIVESSFKKGVIKLLTATPTLLLALTCQQDGS